MPFLEDIMFPLILSISLLQKNAFPMEDRECKARQCRCERVEDNVDGVWLGGVGYRSTTWRSAVSINLMVDMFVWRLTVCVI